MTADLWGDVRSSILFILGQRRPDITFEERVIVAEHAAREVDDLTGDEPTAHDGRVVIEAEGHWDDQATRPLPPLIGPFPSRAAAEDYLRSLAPTWGVFSIAPLTAPEPRSRLAWRDL